MHLMSHEVEWIYIILIQWQKLGIVSEPFIKGVYLIVSISFKYV